MAGARADRPVFAPPTAGLPLRAADLAPGGDRDLEGALARFLGLPAVQLECSGTAALVVALTALKRLAPQRRTVVVPAYTCPLVALAVAHCGLQLRVCELLPTSLDMDPAALATLCGESTLAVMPTHLGGRVTDSAAARNCARAVGAWVIEDAAQALGARVAGHSIGADSDIVFFSLAVGKGLTIFEGGVLAARDPALREALRRTSADTIPRNRAWELRRSIELLAYAALYRPAGLRWAYGRPLRQALARGDWVEAAGDDFDSRIPLHRVGAWRRAVGVRALVRLPDFLATTARQAAPRLARLRGIAGLQVLEDSPAVDAAQGTWPVLLVLLPTAVARDAVLTRLWGAGCGLSLPFVHILPDYERYAAVVPRAAPGELPNARDTASRLLAISNSPWLGDAQFDVVCKALEQASRTG
ncbi:MAG: DegT/DnrJ/EryC1/StrS family aminotransferase [Pseudomonadota bacterium]